MCEVIKFNIFQVEAGLRCHKLHYAHIGAVTINHGYFFVPFLEQQGATPDLLLLSRAQPVAERGCYRRYRRRSGWLAAAAGGRVKVSANLLIPPRRYPRVF